MSLETIFGIIIGVMFVVIIGFVIISIVKFMLPQKIDDATMSSFEEIVNTIKVLETEDKFYKKLILDINDPFMIVGFNGGEDIMKTLFWPPVSGIPGGLHVGKVMHGSIDVLSLKSPCDKTCICICPYTEKTLTDYELYDKACFKYRDKCVEFKNIKNLKGDKTVSEEEYFALTEVYGSGFKERGPYSIIISGNKELIDMKIVIE